MHTRDLETLECQIDDHIVYYHSKIHLAGKRLAWLINDIVFQLQRSDLAINALVLTGKESTNTGFERNGVDRYFQWMIAETSSLFNSSTLCRLELDSLAPILEDIDSARPSILQRRGMMPWWSSYWDRLWQSGPRQNVIFITVIAWRLRQDKLFKLSHTSPRYSAQYYKSWKLRSQSIERAIK